MEKKEFPKLPRKQSFRFQESPQSAIPGVSGKAFAVIKFVLGLFLLPFVYSVSASFLSEISLISRQAQFYFWAGALSFIIIYLFIFEPWEVYRRGHRMLEILFSFFSPLVKVAPYVLPVYTVMIIILYLMLSFFIKSKGIFNVFLLLIGFSTALHLVFSSKTVRGKKGDLLRANYAFGFSFIYIINIMLLALCLSLIFKEYSFISFLNDSFRTAQNIFYAAFRQLFL